MVGTDGVRLLAKLDANQQYYNRFESGNYHASGQEYSGPTLADIPNRLARAVREV